MPLEIEFSSAPLGHEIKGVDLRSIDDSTFAEIEAAYHEYGVIVFRDQFLTSDEQIAFSRRRIGRFSYLPLWSASNGVFNHTDSINFAAHDITRLEKTRRVHAGANSFRRARNKQVAGI